MNATLMLLALLAGGLTVLSPCILPILPPLLSASVSTKLKHRPFWIILGLVLSFTFFGVIFTVFGGFLGLSHQTLRNAALAVLLLLSLTLMWPALWEGFGNRISRLATKIPGTNVLPENQGRLGAILIGMSLGLVWAPCAGPILGIILTLAAVQSSLAHSFALMGSYSLGAGAPMLLIGYGGQNIAKRLRSVTHWGELSHKILGALTFVTVIALYFNVDTLVLSYLPRGFFFAEKLEKRLGAEAPEDAAMNGALSGKLSLLGDMPEFRGISAWLNSGPLVAKNLRGKVVLIDFWTYSCINCIRTLPALTAWNEKYKDQGLAIVGVHTPEFQFESEIGNVKRALARHGITYPVALDNDYGTWNAYSNRYWPAKYLIDAEGRIRKTHFGEGDEEEFESAIQDLLKEARLLKQAPKIVPRATGVDFNRIHSPETYVGYARQENFNSPEAVEPNGMEKYTVPSSLRLNQWALEGTWEIMIESARLASASGKIQHRFHAPQLNLVMKGTDGGVKAVVFLDGKPIPENKRGSDVGADGEVIIRDAKLYNLVNLPDGDAEDHVFELRFEMTGAELYAFTFG